MEFGYTEIVGIRTHEVDQHKLITIPSLLMLMQEASMQNVLKLKASVWDMEEMQISWVLLRKELTILRRPSLGEKIEIRTYPAGFDRVFAYRDFEAYDSAGKRIAFAGSTWTLINTQTRRMVRIPEQFYSFSPQNTSDLLKRPDVKIQEPKNDSLAKTYEVSYYDLDWNGHVNNNVLSRLMLESMPDDLLFKGTIARFDFHIKSECFYKDKLSIRFERLDDKTTLHKIEAEEDQKMVALGRTYWA